MGKTFRRDENWNENRERGLKRRRDVEHSKRRANREDETENEFSDSGETIFQNRENRSGLRR